MSVFGVRGRSRPQSPLESLERSWGVGVCSRCGETLILGDAIVMKRRDGRETVCSQCAAAPAVEKTPVVAAVCATASPASVDEQRFEAAA